MDRFADNFAALFKDFTRNALNAQNGKLSAKAAAVAGGATAIEPTSLLPADSVTVASNWFGATASSAPDAAIEFWWLCFCHFAQVPYAALQADGTRKSAAVLPPIGGGIGTLVLLQLLTRAVPWLAMFNAPRILASCCSESAGDFFFYFLEKF